ncbi:nucleotidyltransferase family protein [Stella sp.]|uniref:nucleotidyltransferase family protein n=1 Tax=Stella sp. TaxID=2912054 RepID=UPI0035B2D43F
MDGTLIEADPAVIAELCRRFHVRRLDLFGSAARRVDFDPERSDIDLLVDYEPGHTPGLNEYFDLRDALQRVYGRKVDLVMTSAIRNPYVRSSIERHRRRLYAA